MLGLDESIAKEHFYDMVVGIMRYTNYTFSEIYAMRPYELFMLIKSINKRNAKESEVN